MAATEILDLEEGSGETGVLQLQCLVGKILTNKPCNITAVSNVCNVAWKTRASFSAIPWSNNTFLFRFEEAEDRDHILKEGPWSVANNLLVLQPLPDGGAVEDVMFTHCPFWIQIHGLLIEKMNRANAELMGRRFGHLLAVENSHDGILLGRSFLRVRAAIKLDDPLPKGFFLRRKPGCGNDPWISCKYEKLTDFCYAFGRIGHENKICKFVSREAGERSGYGPELRTGRARQSAIPIEEIRQQVDEAEARVNLLLQQRPIVHYGDGDERDKGDAGERVRTTQNIPCPLGMRQPRSPAYAGVLDGTGGNTTTETCTTSSPVSSIRLGFIYSDPMKSTLLSSTQIVSDPPNSAHIPNLSLGLNNSPKSIPHLAHSTNTAHHYFVIEPQTAQKPFP